MLFILKPTAACNGVCVYCSAHQEDPAKRMSEDQLAFLLDRIEAFARDRRLKRLTLLWHGGEPLLMGRPFFERALARTQAMEKSLGRPVRHIMQSNITLVDDEMAALLARLLDKQRIGTSYDPLPGYRLLRGDDSYEARWRAGYDALRRAGLGAGVVYVVHRQSLGRAAEIYHGFKAMGFEGGLRFNPLYAAGLARHTRALHITPRQWGLFLRELWAVWNADERSLRVDPLEGWDRLATGRSARMACAFSGRCTQGFTGIRADGAVFSCGRSMDEGVLSFGNVTEAPLLKLMGHVNRRTLLNRVEWLRQGECAGCRWWRLCHGGCPNDAYLGYGDLLRRTVWCEGRRLFLDETYGERFSLQPTLEPSAPDEGMDGDSAEAAP